MLGAPGANMSQNLWILVQNLTGLILHPSGTLGIWETMNIACGPPGKQISGGFYAVRAHNQGAKGGDGLGVTIGCPDTLRWQVFGFLVRLESPRTTRRLTVLTARPPIPPGRDPALPLVPSSRLT